MVTPSIEIYEGLSEELDNVSLRRDKQTGNRIVVMTFENLKALEGFNSFSKQFNNSVRLMDSEGTIEVQPDSVKFIFGGDEGDELRAVQCSFPIIRDDHWERFMRFMNRYAEANRMGYDSKE